MKYFICSALLFVGSLAAPSVLEVIESTQSEAAENFNSREKKSAYAAAPTYAVPAYAAAQYHAAPVYSAPVYSAPAYAAPAYAAPQYAAPTYPAPAYHPVPAYNAPAHYRSDEEEEMSGRSSYDYYKPEYQGPPVTAIFPEHPGPCAIPLLLSCKSKVDYGKLEYKPYYKSEYKPEYKPVYTPEYKPEYKPSYYRENQDKESLLSDKKEAKVSEKMAE